MAAIAFDAAALLLNGDQPAHRLNFPEYSADIKRILESCSPSKTAENIRYVGRKAAEELPPLITVENRRRELQVPPLVGQQPKDQPLEVSPAMPVATVGTDSASFKASNIDMSNCIPNSGFQVRVGVKQRIKVAARAAGSIRAANARASQLRRKINDDQQETVNPINQLIQHGNDKLGMYDSIPNADFPVPVNQRIKVAAHAAGEPFAECSNLPNMSAQDDINQQIPHGKPSQAENIGVSSFSLVHGPLHASINVANTVQVAKLPTSNTNPMPTEMESFGGVTDVERDSYTNNKKSVEYPMRQLP